MITLKLHAQFRLRPWRGIERVFAQRLQDHPTT